jgi:hypothetical protein
VQDTACNKGIVNVLLLAKICEALQKSESNLQNSKCSLDVLSNRLHQFTTEFHADTPGVPYFHRVDKTMSFVILATIANEIDASKDFTTAKGVVCDLPTR